MKLRSLLAVDVDPGILIGLVTATGAIFVSVGYGLKWLLTFRRDGQKSEVAGLWQIIRATETGAAKMETTFNAMVKELDTEREAHADCRIGYSELYQIATVFRGLLVELVQESSNPKRWIPEMPPKREESLRRQEERSAVDKSVKEVAQNTMLLNASKKLAESSVVPPPGAKQ